MKRKERECGEESSEEESSSPSKSKRGKTANSSDRGRAADGTVVGGGFLGSGMPTQPLKTGSCTSQASRAESGPPPVAALAQRAGKSSSSSGDDSDGGREVAMVTARSVFESSRRECRGKTTRGRGNARGRAKRL